MDPILRVIHYLFKKKNITDIEDNINSFFYNDINFWRFVALAFNIEKINSSDPKLGYLIYTGYNNRSAYRYLLENNTEIGKLSPSYTTERDKEILLSLILTKQIYHINFQTTLQIINLIAKPLGIIFQTKEDILSIDCLLILLNILTDGKVPIKSDFEDIDDILIESFDKAKAPLVIDETCLEKQNQFLFFIQLEIIFDFFSEKIKELTGKFPNELKNLFKPSLIKENNKNASDIDKDFEIPIDLNVLNAKNKKKKKQKSKKIECEGNSEYFKEIAQDQVILDTINAIGNNCNLHFTNFYEAIENDNLPKFVLHLLKNDQKSQKFLNDLLKKQDFSNEQKNEIVIEFLKIIEPKFKVLFFDFENPDYIESSIILLYTNLLDFFFLKKSKEELYDRYYTFLYGRYKEGDSMYKSYFQKEEILCDWNSYILLIRFINNKKCKLRVDLADYFDQILNDNSDSKVPIIINELYLHSFPSGIIPKAAYYQLQFIFDALDSSDLSHRLIEYFIITISKFAQIKVPPTDKIATSIRTKNLSLILQNKRYKQNLQIQSANIEIEDDNKNQKINEIKVPKCRSYLDRRCEFSPENIIIINSLSLNTVENIDDFLNEIENNLFFFDGVLIKNNLTLNCHSVWNDLIKHEIADSKKEHMINSGQSPTFLNFKNSFSSSGKKLPIYKLFHFLSKTDEWIFDNDQFQQLYNNEIANDNVQKIPLILFLETRIDSILTILNTINNIQIEETELNDKDICIFALCHKQINEMRFDNKPLYDEKQGKIKPIFLFLHVQERKKKMQKLKRIIPQIFLFLSIISDINLICLEDKICISQIDFLNNLNRLISSFELNENEIEQFKINSNNKITKEFNFEEEEEEEFFEEEHVDDSYNEDINNMKKEFLNKINSNLFNQKMNLFLLIPESHFIFTRPNDKIKESELFRPFKYLNLINNEIHFFHDNNPYTYGFIDNLLRLSVNTKSDWKSICSKFELLKFFTMSRTYADLNFHTELLPNLEKIIHTRFLMLPNENNNSSNYFTCVNLLRKEVLKSFPVFDNNYFLLFNKILSELQDKIIINQNNLLENELKFSSESYLGYLSNLINSRSFLKRKEIKELKNSHFNFLKNEFLAIIHDLAPKNMIASFYMEHIQILEMQIEKDKYKIDIIFETVEENLKVKIEKEVNAKKGTNYTIREKENEREIKAKIETNGELKNLLEQDF